MNRDRYSRSVRNTAEGVNVGSNAGRENIGKDVLVRNEHADASVTTTPVKEVGSAKTAPASPAPISFVDAVTNGKGDVPVKPSGRVDVDPADRKAEGKVGKGMDRDVATEKDEKGVGTDDESGIALDYAFIKDVRDGKKKVSGEFDKKSSRSVELVSQRNMLWIEALKGGESMWWVKYYGGHMISIVHTYAITKANDLKMLRERLIREDDPVAQFNVEDLGQKGLSVSPGSGLHFTEDGVFRVVYRTREESDNRLIPLELHFYRDDNVPVNFRRVEINGRDDERRGRGGDDSNDTKQSRFSNGNRETFESRTNPDGRSNGSRRTDQPSLDRGSRGSRGGRYGQRP